MRTAAETVVDIHMNEAPGDILMFLPGQGHIEQMTDLIQEVMPKTAEEYILRPLFGAMPWDEQIKAIAPSRVDRVSSLLFRHHCHVILYLSTVLTSVWKTHPQDRDRHKYC